MPLSGLAGLQSLDLSDCDGVTDLAQDVLMPRKLEVHFEDGFQAVREAVRRRIG